MKGEQASGMRAFILKSITCFQTRPASGYGGDKYPAFNYYKYFGNSVKDVDEAGRMTYYGLIVWGIQVHVYSADALGPNYMERYVIFTGS